MTLDDGDDAVVGMVTIAADSEETIMVVSEQGYGKRSVVDDYRITNRGGKGVKTINVTDKTGKLVAINAVSEENDLVIINKSGITLRLHVSDIPVRGRYTMGVRLINLSKRGDVIASVCCVPADPEAEAEKPDMDEAEIAEIDAESAIETDDTVDLADGEAENNEE